MPELPEVQTVADHIKPDLVGKNILGIEPVWEKVLHNFFLYHSLVFFYIPFSAAYHKRFY